LHEKVLPKGSRGLLEALTQQNPSPWDGWTLAGGTGLALQLGHRHSEDFDFFRQDPFDPDPWHQAFAALGPYQTLQASDRTLSVSCKGIKFSFFQVGEPWLFPLIPFRSLFLADPRDIGLMKLAAIAGRGSRRDFVDLYVLLRRDGKLSEYFAWLPQKYQAGRTHAYHILRSLTYFEDAENEPLPRMFEPFDWEECKAFFIRQAHALVLG
jgi:hypothetical protein